MKLNSFLVYSSDIFFFLFYPFSNFLLIVGLFKSFTHSTYIVSILILCYMYYKYLLQVCGLSSTLLIGLGHIEDLNFNANKYIRFFYVRFHSFVKKWFLLLTVSYKFCTQILLFPGMSKYIWKSFVHRARSSDWILFLSSLFTSFAVFPGPFIK